MRCETVSTMYTYILLYKANVRAYIYHLLLDNFQMRFQYSYYIAVNIFIRWMVRLKGGEVAVAVFENGKENIFIMYSRIKTECS